MPCGRLAGGALADAGALVHRSPRAWPTTRRRGAVDLDRADGLGGGGAGGRAGAAPAGGGAARRWPLPLCLLSAALVLNVWVGYFPTVQSAWNQLTAGPLPDQTDRPP